MPLPAFAVAGTAFVTGHETDPAGHITTFAYDAAGNETERHHTVILNGVPTPLITRQSWDANGNLTSKTTPNGTITYAWNTENKLKEIDKAATGEKISYGYGATDNCISKTRQIGSTKIETQWFIDSARPYSEIVTERSRVNNSAWSTTATYVHTPDGVGELISQNRHIYQDAQGSNRIIAGESNIEQVLSFDAFGNRADGFGYVASSDAQIDHQYVGEYYDADSGLYHLRARDYDPRTGRFTAMDEFEGVSKMPSSLNRYNYASSDPVNNADPSGRFTLGGMMSGINVTSIMRYMSLPTLGIMSVVLDQKGNRRFGVWDAIVISMWRGFSLLSQTVTQTLTQTMNKESKEKHHTIPVYLCGSMDQEKSEIDHSVHAQIHTDIAGFALALENAEGYATRVLGRNRSEVVLRTAQTFQGRAAIASGLQYYYESNWIGVGAPPIVSVFHGEKHLYISGERTSLPWCARTGVP
jgi:RHS repeat-associated protein